MRVVFDTNTLISAALFAQSVPRQALDRAIIQGELLTSESCLAELNQVLHRPKFVRYLTPFEADLFINQYSLRIRLVEVTSSLTDCRDPKDNKFLEVAFDGQASCIITGDQDLLILNPYRAISIFTPTDFLDWLSV